MADDSYFPNNLETVMNSEFPSMEFTELMEEVLMWDLPSSVLCVIRSHNLKTNKVQEFTYQRRMPAQKRLMQLAESGENEITVVDENAIYMIFTDDQIENNPLDN